MLRFCSIDSIRKRWRKLQQKLRKLSLRNFLAEISKINKYIEILSRVFTVFVIARGIFNWDCFIPRSGDRAFFIVEFLECVRTNYVNEDQDQGVDS